MRLLNIPKLLSHEDPFHVHKLLGVGSLAHFGYRVYTTAVRPEHSMGFVEGAGGTLALIAMHAALSGTSLLFHIPRNRVRKLPMIWPEFRLHSIIFAYRSLLAMLCFWLDGYFQTRLFSYVRGGLVVTTLVSADIVTAYYKKIDQLKPGETTMRSMPFPEQTPAAVIRATNFYYSFSQVLATLNILFAMNMNRAFAALFPIQLAAFLMTLVRKSILTAGEWHVAYGAALGINYVYAAVAPDEGSIPLAAYWCIAAAFVVLRFRYNMNKYLLWSSIVGYHVVGLQIQE